MFLITGNTASTYNQTVLFCEELKQNSPINCKFGPKIVVMDNSNSEITSLRYHKHFYVYLLLVPKNKSVSKTCSYLKQCYILRV